MRGVGVRCECKSPRVGVRASPRVDDHERHGERRDERGDVDDGVHGDARARVAR